MPVSETLDLTKYRQYGVKHPKTGGVHTGIDLATPDRWVFATAPGKVVLVQPLCNKDHKHGPNQGCLDRGMGNTVIIEHELEDGTKVYSLYAHLAEIGSTIKEGAVVRDHEKIGKMGASGYGEMNYWLEKKNEPIHLHFEIKEEAVLGDPKTGQYFGYIPPGKNPDNYGYRNPYDFFGKKRVKAEPAAVGVPAVVGVWVPEIDNKVAGRHSSTLEFREDGTVISTMTYSGKWKLRGDGKVALSIDPRFFPGSPREQVYQIRGDALSGTYGNVVTKARDARLIQSTAQGKVWSRYEIDAGEQKMELELEEDGTFISTVYVYGRYRTDGRVIEVYTSGGTQSPWMYELKGEKIEVKLKGAPEMDFVSFVRASAQKVAERVGKGDIREAIIGKWERYDEEFGRDIIEFFQDGSVSASVENFFGTPMTVAGDYRFIDSDHVRIELGGFWALAGPMIFQVSVSEDKLVMVSADGEVNEYRRVSPSATGPKQIEPIEKREEETVPEIAGYTASFRNLNYFLGSMRGEVLKCPEEGCKDYEEEAARVIISHLLTKRSGEWLSGFIAWQIAKKLILSGLDELAKMVISLGEVKIKEIIGEIKYKFEKSLGADIKVVDLGWKNIGVLPIYLPYEGRDGPYGKVDGEALMVFYSPHSISIKEIKDQVKSGGPLYVPPLGLNEKLRQLPDGGVVRPFTLIIRGTVYEEGEVAARERWGETIEGPLVVF
jgi:murein DD-endopeptidase MepM/ murein hydrolase activator NlpD